jgi:hypothetical protein
VDTWLRRWVLPWMGSPSSPIRPSATGSPHCHERHPPFKINRRSAQATGGGGASSRLPHRSLIAASQNLYLATANVGDCRAVISRRGKAIALSNDHKVTDPRE